LGIAGSDCSGDSPTDARALGLSCKTGATKTSSTRAPNSLCYSSHRSRRTCDALSKSSTNDGVYSAVAFSLPVAPFERSECGNHGLCNIAADPNFHNRQRIIHERRVDVAPHHVVAPVEHGEPDD